MKQRAIRSEGFMGEREKPKQWAILSIGKRPNDNKKLIGRKDGKLVPI